MAARPSAKVAGLGSSGTGTLFDERSKRLAQACVRDHVDAERVKTVVGGDEEVAGRWIGSRERQIVGSRHLTCAARRRRRARCRIPATPFLRYPRRRWQKTGGPHVPTVLCITPATPGFGAEVHREAVFDVPVGRAADLGERRAHADDAAQHLVDLVDHVRALRAQPAAALRGVAPPRRDLAGRVGQHREVHQEGRELRLADLARARLTPRRGCLARTPIGIRCRGGARPAGGLGRVEHRGALPWRHERRASRTARACRRRRPRARSRRGCGAAWRSSPRRPREGRARRRGWCSRVGDVEAPARVPMSSRDRARRALCTSNPAARSARRCVMQPNPVPTIATPVTRASRSCPIDGADPMVGYRSEERELGPSGRKSCSRTSRCGLWVLRLAPGERSAVHRHDLDHLLIQIRGDRIAVAPRARRGGPASRVHGG